MDLAPSDRTVTANLVFTDILATTPTNVDATYYLFTSDGKYFTSGQAGSDGAAAVDVNYGGTYKLLGMNDSTQGGGTTDYYPAETTFTADEGGSAQIPVSLQLYKESNATVSDIRDPVDLNANISTGLGATSDFEILFKATTSNAAVHKPVIAVLYNSTCITSATDLTISGASSVDCPSRITSTQGATQAYTCFDTGIEWLKSADSLKTFRGSVKFSATTACGTTNGLTGSVIDTGMYLDPNYQTVGYSAFHWATEDENDNSNIGATDSATDFVQFAG